MAVGAVVIVTIFVGLNITTWTSWVWWTLGIEILLIWVYTVRTVLRCDAQTLTRPSTGCLFCHQTKLVPNSDLRQQPLPVPFRIFLARRILLGTISAPSKATQQGVQVHL